MKTNRVANLLVASILLTLISAGVKYFSAHEDTLPFNDLALLKEALSLNNAIQYTSYALICFISVVALKTLLDKEKKNKELLEDLHDSNKTLEANVRERTSELEKKSVFSEKLNRDLQDNFEELQSFYETLHTSNAKAEDTLKEMRDLYDNAPAGYHSLSAEGLIVRMNNTELVWLGYTREEVVGKMHVTQILLPEEHESYRKDFSIFLKQGYVRNKSHTFVRKDGSTFRVLLNATAMYDNNGNFVMSRGVTYRTDK